MSMDIVQISHIRIFANAVATALQASVDQNSARVVHTQGMLAAFGRSAQASNFIHALVASAGEPVKDEAKAPEQPSNQGASEPASASVSSTSFLKAPPLQSQSEKLSLSGVLASRFFVQIPWGGRAVEARLNTHVPTHTVLTEPWLQTKAVAFFAGLPWTGSKTMAQVGTQLSIGAGADHADQATLLSKRLGQGALPAFFNQGMGLPEPDVIQSAVSFFSKIPWAGQRPASTPKSV